MTPALFITLLPVIFFFVLCSLTFAHPFSTDKEKTKKKSTRALGMGKLSQRKARGQVATHGSDWTEQDKRQHQPSVSIIRQTTTNNNRENSSDWTMSIANAENFKQYSIVLCGVGWFCGSVSALSFEGEVDEGGEWGMRGRRRVVA